MTYNPCLTVRVNAFNPIGVLQGHSRCCVPSIVLFTRGNWNPFSSPNSTARLRTSLIVFSALQKIQATSNNSVSASRYLFTGVSRMTRKPSDPTYISRRVTLEAQGTLPLTSSSSFLQSHCTSLFVKTMLNLKSLSLRFTQVSTCSLGFQTIGARGRLASSSLDSLQETPNTPLASRVMIINHRTTQLTPFRIVTLNVYRF